MQINQRGQKKFRAKLREQTKYSLQIENSQEYDTEKSW